MLKKSGSPKKPAKTKLHGVQSITRTYQITTEDADIVNRAIAISNRERINQQSVSAWTREVLVAKARMIVKKEEKRLAETSA